ncbi:MAG: SIMPL domain-containing protein [Oscillospiraceae bacterium]|nr:SIMPL domain-containing protein [Oscillospiraceae bacterium]
MNRTITVKGIGKVSAKPDYIVLSMSLKAKDMDYEKMMSMAAEQLDNLRKAIVGVGFQRDDLKTSNFNVQPEYQSERDSKGNYKRWFDGYVCNHALKLEFDFDMERLAQTFSALAKCLAEPEFSVQFTVKDKDAISTQLLQNATENAKAKAEILASAAGVALGQLITIDYNWGELHLYSPTQYEVADRCHAEAPCGSNIDIEPDDIDVSDTVTFVWEIG